MRTLGQLHRDDLRSVWPHEAHDFTPWMADHLEDLAAVLGMELELVRTESEAGNFSIDILARDLGRDRLVVIENQLTSTDHSHLGQSITYAAHVDAVAVVWVCKEFREEHKAALEWLNRGLETTGFFGVEVDVLRIGDSLPAVDFRLVAAPRGRSRGPRAADDCGKLSEKSQKYRAFFQDLIDVLREEHHFTNARAGQPQSWHAFTAGITGISYGASFARGGRLRTELYIDSGDGDDNLEVFESLKGEADAIVEELGTEVEWEELEQRRACRIAIYRDGSILDGEGPLDEYHTWLVDSLLQFKRTFGKRIRAIAESKKAAA